MLKKQPNQNCQHFPECGGCNFLDLSPELYQQTKQDLIHDDYPDIHWIWVGPHSRRKVTLQISKKNVIGFFGAKSNDIIEVNSCFVAEKEISDIILPLKNLLLRQGQNLFSQAVFTLFDNGLDLVLKTRRELSFVQTQKLLEFAKKHNLNISYLFEKHLTPILLLRKNQIFYDGFKIDLEPNIFIQATKLGLDVISHFIRTYLEKNKKIKHVVDIFSGFGSYSFAIQDLVTSVTGYEGDKKMVDLMNKNIISNGFKKKITAQNHDLFFTPINRRDLNKFDLAVINPPRNGATPQVKQLVKSDIKSIIYVSCNPKTFKIDSRILTDEGFKIKKIIALDQFYSTNHLELLAIFEK